MKGRREEKIHVGKKEKCVCGGGGKVKGGEKGERE